MTKEIEDQMSTEPQKGFSGRQVVGIVLISVTLAIVVTVMAIKFVLFPSPFEPVVLSAQEEQQLTAKLEAFERIGSPDQDIRNRTLSPQKSNKPEFGADGTLIPEKYSEEGLSREINFTEREINSLIAKNTDLAEKLAVDLAENMVSIKLLIPMDPDFPMLGGKTLKVNTGAELAYREGRPVVVLKGVSVMGVPMPNAWLGSLKNIDLVKEFGTDRGFWRTFSDGVDSISVADGFLKIRLKE